MNRRLANMYIFTGLSICAIISTLFILLRNEGASPNALVASFGIVCGAATINAVVSRFTHKSDDEEDRNALMLCSLFLGTGYFYIGRSLKGIIVTIMEGIGLVLAAIGFILITSEEIMDLIDYGGIALAYGFLFYFSFAWLSRLDIHEYCNKKELPHTDDLLNVEMHVTDVRASKRGLMLISIASAILVTALLGIKIYVST